MTTHFSNNLKHLRLLLEYPPGQAVVDEDWQSCLSPDFLTFTDRHRISASLFPIIRCLPASGTDQALVREKFQNRYLSQLAFNERSLTLYRELWKHLQDNCLGEHVVFPGGVFFGRRFYKHHSQGFVPIIDICLVTPELKNELVKLLSERGYSPYPGTSQPISGSGFAHACGFRRNRFSINIHFNTGPFLANHESTQLAAHRESHVFDGICYPVLSSEYELIWKILTVYRDIESGDMHLDVLLDIHAFIQTAESAFDWSVFFQNRADDGRLVLATNVLDMVLTLFQSHGKFATLEESLSRHRTNCLVISEQATQGIVENTTDGFARLRHSLILYPGSLSQALGRKALSTIISRRTSAPGFAENLIFGGSAQSHFLTRKSPNGLTIKTMRGLKRVVRGGKRVLYKRCIENRHRQLFGEYYGRIQTSEKIVALTFDDGPLEPYTSNLLKVLEKHQVKAAFFMLGMQADHFPSLVREVIAQGHQVGNHSYSHPRMIWMSPARISSEIDRTDAVLSGLGVKGEIMFRAPHGEQFLVLPYILQRKKKKNILFDFFPNPPDWSDESAAASAASIVEQTRPGSIIVLHDGKSAGHKVCEIADDVIRKLKQKGYAFRIVSDLIALADVR